jgi:hypothetical protein
MDLVIIDIPRRKFESYFQAASKARRILRPFRKDLESEKVIELRGATRASDASIGRLRDGFAAEVVHENLVERALERGIFDHAMGRVI